MNRRTQRRVVTYASVALLLVYLGLILVNVLIGLSIESDSDKTTIETAKPKSLAAKSFIDVKVEKPKSIQNSKISSDELCRGEGLKPLFPKGRSHPIARLDFRKEEFSFLTNFKNPCFYRNVTYYDQKDILKPVHTLRCLPYFFIIGMPKSGTTDIWHGLELHPGVAIKQHMKEPMFFTRRRYPQDMLLQNVPGLPSDKRRLFFTKYKQAASANWTLDRYLDYFHAATNAISNTPSPDRWHGDQMFYYLITGEGTVDISHDNDNWQLVPGNEGCSEPRVLNSDYLYHLNPNMKLIFMMRNPIDRVFSDYLYESQFFGYEKTVGDFHVAVLESMASHLSCRMYFTERGCAYNSTLESFKARLRVGMYHIFLEDWFRVFPREQIMIIQFEDFIKNRISYLKKVFRFLGLRPLSEKEENIHKKRKIPNTKTKKDREIGDMMPKTRKILKEFYRHFNKRLSDILDDKRYMWDS